MSDPLFPGRVVVLDEANNIKATVFPLGVVHIRKFQRQLTTVMTTLQSMKLPNIEDKKAVEAFVMAELIPIVLNDAFDMLADCIRITRGDAVIPFEQMPHWHLAPVATTWLEESFGSEEKVRPWKEALARMMKALPAPPKKT